MTATMFLRYRNDARFAQFVDGCVALLEDTTGEWQQDTLQLAIDLADEIYTERQAQRAYEAMLAGRPRDPEAR